MLENALSRLTNPPRTALNVARAGLAAAEDMPRQLRDLRRRLDEVLGDVHVMRTIAERLDERVAHLQRQAEAFDARIAHVERMTDTVAQDVKKGTDRLPDPNDGALHKLKTALTGSEEPGGEAEGNLGARATISELYE